MKALTLKFTGLFILALLFASSPAIAQADCDLQKVVVKTKKKKKKKNDPEVVSKPKVIETDTSKICPTYTTANIDKEILADKFINMALLSMSGRHEMAFKNWECIYNNAPGYSILVYTSGAEIYVDRAKKAKEDENQAKVEEYGEEAKGDDADSHTLKRATQYALHMHHGLDRIERTEAEGIASTCKRIASGKQDQNDYKVALEEIDYYMEYYAGLEQQAAEKAQQKVQSTQNSALKDADGQLLISLT